MAFDAVLGLSLLFTKRLGDYMYPIVFTALVSFLEDYSARYVGHIYKSNIWYYFLVNPIEYAGFAWFFIVNINNLFVKKLIKISIVVSATFVLAYTYFFFQLPILKQTIIHDYQIAFKAGLLIVWSVIYIVDIFNQINNFKKLNVFVLMMVGAILFYFSFDIIFRLSEIYLFKYSESHHISLYAIFSPSSANMYASKQYTAIKPLLLLTNILLYLCIFVALIKSVVVPKKSIKASV